MTPFADVTTDDTINIYEFQFYSIMLLTCPHEIILGEISTVIAFCCVIENYKVG